ncbi:MAG: hypothetical protein QCI38_06640, partial [Candidatus Thermoplasmatota archaeon]|nr:hypothetical protein [Candidatus Thermoplasmatota archaeon]
GPKKTPGLDIGGGHDMSRDPYGLKDVIKKAQRDSMYLNPTCFNDPPKRRTKSFKNKLIGEVVERAGRDGIFIEMPDEEPIPPPARPRRSETILPGRETRITEHGIKPAEGVLGLVHNMHELEDSEFILFYIEAAREYHKRTGDEGWIGKIVEHVLSVWESRCPAERPEAGTKAERTKADAPHAKKEHFEEPEECFEDAGEWFEALAYAGN